MKKLLLVIAVAVSAGAWAPVQAQGTFSNEGPVVDKMKAVIAAYESGDWASYRAAFADTVKFTNNTIELTLEERMEEHEGIHEVFEGINFVDPFYAAVENEGETWGLLWGIWNAKVKSTGEQINVMVHVASRQQDGLTVEELGYWDMSVIGPIMEAAAADM